MFNVAFARLVELRLDALVFAEVLFSSAGIALPWVTTVGTAGNWLVCVERPHLLQLGSLVLGIGCHCHGSQIIEFSSRLRGLS